MTLRSFVSLTAGRALGKFARTSSWGLTSWPIDNASLECSHERCHGSYGIRRISFQAFLAFCSLGAEDRVLLWFVRHECKRENRWGGGYHWLWSRIVLRGKAGIYLFVDRHRRPIQVRQTGNAGFFHFGGICVNARTAYIESQINSRTKKKSRWIHVNVRAPHQICREGTHAMYVRTSISTFASAYARAREHVCMCSTLP